MVVSVLFLHSLSATKTESPTANSQKEHFLAQVAIKKHWICCETNKISNLFLQWWEDHRSQLGIWRGSASKQKEAVLEIQLGKCCWCPSIDSGGTELKKMPINILKMPINILRVGIKRMGPGSFQWCPATGQGAMGTNWSLGNSIWTQGRTSSLWGWRSTGTGCPGMLWILLLWSYSKPTWTRSCATGCRWPCFGSGVVLNNPQRSLPTPTILWFCDSVI